VGRGFSRDIRAKPPAKLIVDPPLAEPLARGMVFIQYRTENLRACLPQAGIGHLHISVDDAPWHFVEVSGETVILVGLPPAPHRVLFELADHPQNHHQRNREIHCAENLVRQHFQQSGTPFLFFGSQTL
jgi:Family of unknown function (DUF6130)